MIPTLTRALSARLVSTARALSLAAILAAPALGWFSPSSGRAQESPDELTRPGPHQVGITQRAYVARSATGGDGRVLDTFIWYPAERVSDAVVWHRGWVDAPLAGSDPLPLVVFSHGSGAEPWSSSFLTAHLASHGFIVVAPAHTGNTAHDCPGLCLSSSETARAALLESALNRPSDLAATIDQALGNTADPILGGRLNANRIGIVGHSFGGWTSVVAAARDPRIKAIVPMAPAVIPGMLEIASHVNAPSLLLTGDEDTLPRFASEPLLSAALARGGAPHWMVTLNGAGHLSFADVCLPLFGGCGALAHTEAQHITLAWSTAFLKRFLADDARSARWLDPAIAQGPVAVQAANLP